MTSMLLEVEGTFDDFGVGRDHDRWFAADVRIRQTSAASEAGSSGRAGNDDGEGVVRERGCDRRRRSLQIPREDAQERRIDDGRETVRLVTVESTTADEADERTLVDESRSSCSPAAGQRES